MAGIAVKTKTSSDQIRDAGTYMTGQTVAYSLPQGDNVLYYAANQSSFSPNYCYVIWQIPPNMNRVNTCSVFWKCFPAEWQPFSDYAIRYHVSTAGNTNLKCEISIDEGTTWQTVGSYSAVQSNLSLITYINQLQNPSGKIMMVRLSCTVDTTGARVIAGGYMQGNLWSR